DTVNRAEYSPDGSSIVTASADHTARVWDAATGQLRFTLQGHSEAVNTAAYSPDGRHIVTASNDAAAIIWDATNGQLHNTLRGQAGSMTSAVYSPDNRDIVTVSYDGIRFWTAEPGYNWQTIKGNGANA